MSYPSFLVTTTADENNQNNVTIAFTMAVKALEKGNDTAIMLLSGGVKLATEGYADKINIGEPFKPVKELFSTYLEKGGKLLVCGSCMEHNGISKDELIKEATVINAGDVIDYITNVHSTLQLNG